MENKLETTISKALTLTNGIDFEKIITQPPPKEWLKPHPMATKKVKGQTVPTEYIPIERVEWLLTCLYKKWKVEIKRTELIGNSIHCIVRLHYYDRFTEEWEWQDGQGAAPLQTDKGAGAIEFNKLKSSAVMIASPAAESYAVKDAAEKIGKLFGKDLNRADQIFFDQMIVVSEEQQELLDRVKNIPIEKLSDPNRKGLIKRIMSDNFQELKKSIIDYIEKLEI